MRFFALVCTPLLALIGLSPAVLLLAARLWNMAELPIWDPSEARYATLSVNMARTDDYVRPAFWHRREYRTFSGKPPLAFQLGGLACEALGETPFAVRLPSLLAALGALGLLGLAAGAARPVCLCMTAIGFLGFAGVCMTDMPLTCAVMGMLTAFWRYARRPSMGWALAGGAFAAAGFLIKGPVALALGGLPAVVWMVLNGRPEGLRRRHVALAALLFLALATPWFVIMEQREPGTLRYFFLNENLGRFLVQEYGDRFGSGHKFFFGCSVPWLAALALPWTPWFFRRVAWRGLRICFPAVATLTMVGFWALTPRVPLAYLLPAVPLAAWWLAERPARAFRWWPAVAVIQAVVVVALALLLPKIKPAKFPEPLYRALPADATLSFEHNNPPYSAEFYLGPRVCRTGERDGDFIARRRDGEWLLAPNAAPHPSAVPNSHTPSAKTQPHPCR